TLRIAVASRALGKAGSVQMPVDVPKASGNKILLGGVVIGTAGARAEAMTEADAIEGLVPFQPTTTRVFAASDTLRVFARAFWGSKDPAVTMTLTVTGSSKAAPQSLSVNGVHDQNGRLSAVIDTTVPLAGLAPGRYQLAVNARLSNGQPATRIVPLEIK
ncbi:MAG TPA: hypothetical protein VLT86_12245, partial [Vicinamibacterales bacterium]|nr:hypothetical protein [Vicinamibacterales bacterium]